jgi:hypothetical protein
MWALIPLRLPLASLRRRPGGPGQRMRMPAERPVHRRRHPLTAGAYGLP